MTSLFRTGKNCTIFAAMALLFLLFSVKVVFADPCPDLPENLKQKLAEYYPGYTLRDYRSMESELLQDIVRNAPGVCYHLVKLSQTSYVLSLFHETIGKKKVVVAESLLYGNMTGWSTYDVESFDQEIPLLEQAKAGMYLDVAEKKYFMITRNSQAFKIVLLPSREEFIYELPGKKNVKKYRIR